MRRSDGYHLTLVLTIVAFAPFGCQARVLVPSDGDVYRQKIRTLDARVAELEANNSELKANLVSARSAMATSASTTFDDAQAAILAATPRAVRIAIVSGSSLERTSANPALGELTLYLETLDSRGRFVQVAGTLSVSVISLPGPGQGEPLRIAAVELSPKELRDAWRSGLFGTHYTVALPLDLSRADGVQSAAISVELRDGVEGRKLTAMTPMSLADATGVKQIEAH